MNSHRKISSILITQLPNKSTVQITKFQILKNFHVEKKNNKNLNVCIICIFFKILVFRKNPEIKIYYANIALNLHLSSVTLIKTEYCSSVLKTYNSINHRDAD